ncbi:MAG: ABC transporter permease subunit [Pseudorhodoplanes sp.]|nr:putative aliphatic sulfonates transport permease protein SsuC [Pseudorhodoplanes sp.]MBW7948458.1 ABC transporter permease subunit [Pseudorhodoplanes sp.]MCL4711162.1 ABC transporter permease subunit [Pseudorhodoplanes sp.]GIK80322.1 MAG: ABC transporter permease [Alphaproteobacteria bacterium]
MKEVARGDRWVKLISLSLLVGLWYAVALLPAKSVFPPPHVVLLYLIEDVQSWAIWSHLLATLSRIFFGFSLAMAVAVPAGILLGFSGLAQRLFGTWVLIGLMTPSLVFIILVYTSMGLNDIAAVVAAAMTVIPVLVVNIWENAKAVDSKLVQMARVFNLSTLKIVRQIVLPQLAPPLLASARFGLGLVWKMVLFVELLGRSNGIGYQIEYYYQLFNMGRVLEYTVFFVGIMLIIEVVILGGIEHRLFRWRPAARLG